MSFSISQPVERRLTLKLLGALVVAVPLRQAALIAATHSHQTVSPADGAEAVFDSTDGGVVCRFRLYRSGALIREIKRPVGGMTIREFEDFFERFKASAA